MPRENPAHVPMKYLATSSDTSLESFRLSRMNRAANLRKELFDVVEEWIEAEVEARVAERLLERSEQERAGPIDVAPLIEAGAERAALDRCKRCSRRSIRADADARIARDANVRDTPGAGEMHAPPKVNALRDENALERRAVSRLHTTPQERVHEFELRPAPNNVSRIDQLEDPRNLRDVLPHHVLCDIPPVRSSAARYCELASRSLLRPRPLRRCLAR
jgi:hypothetical protein